MAAWGVFPFHWTRWFHFYPVWGWKNSDPRANFFPRNYLVFEQECWRHLSWLEMVNKKIRRLHFISYMVVTIKREREREHSDDATRTKTMYAIDDKTPETQAEVCGKTHKTKEDRLKVKRWRRRLRWVKTKGIYHIFIMYKVLWKYYLYHTL